MLGLAKTYTFVSGAESPLEVTPRALEPIFQNLCQISRYLNNFLLCFQIMYELPVFYSRGTLLGHFLLLETNYMLHFNNFSTTKQI